MIKEVGCCIHLARDGKNRPRDGDALRRSGLAIVESLGTERSDLRNIEMMLRGDVLLAHPVACLREFLMRRDTCRYLGADQNLTTTISIIDKAHVSSDSISDDVDEIVESNILVEPSKLFEFPCADYGVYGRPTKLSSSESSEFLVMIQQIISSVSLFTSCLEFVRSPVYHH